MEKLYVKFDKRLYLAASGFVTKDKDREALQFVYFEVYKENDKIRTKFTGCDGYTLFSVYDNTEQPESLENDILDFQGMNNKTIQFTDGKQHSTKGLLFGALLKPAKTKDFNRTQFEYCFIFESDLYSFSVNGTTIKMPVNQNRYPSYNDVIPEMPDIIPQIGAFGLDPKVLNNFISVPKAFDDNISTVTLIPTKSDLKGAFLVRLPALEKYELEYSALIMPVRID